MGKKKEKVINVKRMFHIVIATSCIELEKQRVRRRSKSVFCKNSTSQKSCSNNTVTTTNSSSNNNNKKKNRSLSSSSVSSSSSSSSTISYNNNVPNTTNGSTFVCSKNTI